MIKINEIFHSIQGESSYAGWPTVFVRTSGCPLRCTYCDTKYAYYEGEKFSEEQILNKIKSYNAKYVCITGGEPLAQPRILNLMKQLCDLNYKVSLETSGSICVEHVDARVKKIIDVKTPDSGAANTFDKNNLIYATPLDEFKFVICSEKDLQWSESFVKEFQLFNKHLVLFSPSYGEINETWLAEKMLSKNLNAKMQLQMHKYIWGPEKTGV